MGIQRFHVSQNLLSTDYIYVENVSIYTKNLVRIRQIIHDVRLLN